MIMRNLLDKRRVFSVLNGRRDGDYIDELATYIHQCPFSFLCTSVKLISLSNHSRPKSVNVPFQSVILRKRK